MNSNETAVNAENPPLQFAIPLEGRVRIRFGDTLSNGETANGIQIDCADGDTVHAGAPGTVQATGHDTANSYYVQIRHTGGWVSQYTNLQTLDILQGDTVTQGQPLGSAAGHLWLHIRLQNQFYNPLDVINPDAIRQK